MYGSPQGCSQRCGHARDRRRLQSRQYQRIPGLARPAERVANPGVLNLEGDMVPDRLGLKAQLVVGSALRYPKISLATLPQVRRQTTTICMANTRSAGS